MMSIVFQALGGLGMFLFGMKIMSEGFQKIAGRKIRQILSLVSSNRFSGCLVGTLVTAIIQSSSASTVMLVSFVDAGLMTLRQAVAVILGANIGTTVTAQLISFKIQDFALPAIALGVLLKFFSGGRKRVYLGDVFLGFGLVFFGLSIMKSGFAPLKHHADFISLFTKFNVETLSGILLCVLTGTILTMILQSSSATVGITMALASQGLLSFETSVALILGDNIGTTITAELASIGTSINAHRTARAHTLFNTVGVLIILIFFPIFIKLVIWLTSSLQYTGPPDLFTGGEKPYISRYIANSHTIFNVINAVIFLIFLPTLTKMAVWLTPQRKDEAVMEDFHHVRYLDSRYINTPSVAFRQVNEEIIRMGDMVKLMYDHVVRSFQERKGKELSVWRKREESLDILRKEITQFLLRITQGSITSEESREMRSMLRMANNLERIGDAVDDIAKRIQELIEMGLYLSEEGMKDYVSISHEVGTFLNDVLHAMRHDKKEFMSEATTIKISINTMVENMKEAHLLRLQEGSCKVEPGLIFV
ncbi:MAG: Na/Pi cotransporter family protein, partial [Pseudomonadota bacterium]